MAISLAQGKKELTFIAKALRKLIKLRGFKVITYRSVLSPNGLMVSASSREDSFAIIKLDLIITPNKEVPIFKAAIYRPQYITPVVRKFLKKETARLAKLGVTLLVRKRSIP